MSESSPRPPWNGMPVVVAGGLRDVCRPRRRPRVAADLARDCGILHPTGPLGETEENRRSLRLLLGDMGGDMLGLVRAVSMIGDSYPG